MLLFKYVFYSFLFLAYNSIILPLTRHNKIFAIDNSNDFTEENEMTVDLYVGTPGQRITLKLTNKDFSGVWLHTNNDISQGYRPYFYSSNISSTYSYQNSEVGFFMDRNFVSAKIGKDVVTVEDIKKEKYAIKSCSILLDKQNTIKYYGSNIGGILGLTNKEFFHDKYSTGIIDNLMNITAIKERYYVMGKDKLFLGESPYNKSEFSQCSLRGNNDKYYLCSLTWNNFNIENEKGYAYKAIFQIEYSYINAPERFFSFLIGKYFKSLITQRKCFLKDIPMTIRWIECNRDIDTSTLSSFSFSFGTMNMTFTAKELFVPNDKNSTTMIFGIVYQVKEQLLYDWIFGDIALNKYYTLFDMDTSAVGIYPISPNEKTKNEAAFTITVIALIFCLLGSIFNCIIKKKLII